MAGKERIGWVGLGKMGAPMAKNVLKSGYPLTVYNRTREKTKELAELGARVADSPKFVASGSEVVISMILGDRALEDVSLGPEGILQGAGSGLIYIDMSTVSAVMSARVAEAADEPVVMEAIVVVSVMSVVCGVVWEGVSGHC